MKKTEKSASAQTYDRGESLKNAGQLFAELHPIQVTHNMWFAQNAEECLDKIKAILVVRIFAVIVMTAIAVSTLFWSLGGDFNKTPLASGLVCGLSIMFFTAVSSMFGAWLIKCRSKNVLNMADAWKPIRKTLVRELRYSKIKITQCREDAADSFGLSLVNWINKEVFPRIGRKCMKRTKLGKPDSKKLVRDKDTAKELWSAFVLEGKPSRVVAEVFENIGREMTDRRRIQPTSRADNQ